MCCQLCGLKRFGLKWASLWRWDSGELVVIDAMKLRRDVAGVKVEDTADGQGVLTGDSKVEAASIMRFPFGNLVTVLEHRVQNVGWAAPDVGPLKMAVVAKASASKNLDRRKTSQLLRHIDPEIDGMIEGERPEIESSLSGPMDGLMKHHGPGPLGNGANGALSDSVLMMSANTRVTDGLALVRAILHKVVSAKQWIVGAIVFNISAVLERPTFKLVLRLEGFANTKGNLMRMTDNCRGMVDKESAAGIALWLGLFSFGVWQTFVERWHVLMGRDVVAREKVAGAKNILMSGVWNKTVWAWTVTTLPGKLTGCAEGSFARGGSRFRREENLGTSSKLWLCQKGLHLLHVGIA
jgi:hypothetical protein